MNPIVVHGVMYSPTPAHRVVALDAATGARKWSFDAGLESRGPNRGVAFWESGAERRLFVAVDQYLYALDAATGVPIPGFGEQGRVDLRRGLGRDPSAQSIRLTTPGIIYRDLLIIGGRAGEGTGASPGDIRALDVRTGTVKWTFHTIPHPGEEGYTTWSETSWKVNGGANNWAGMALDEARGLVFVPTGSAAPDFHGADRAGDNLFANCVLALDAATGRKRLALPGGAPRHLGSRLPFAADAGHRASRRPGDRRGGADHQAGLRLRPRSRHRPAAVPRGRTAGARQRRARRARLAHAAGAAPARAVCAAAADGGFC